MHIRPVWVARLHTAHHVSVVKARVHAKLPRNALLLLDIVSLCLPLACPSSRLRFSFCLNVSRLSCRQPLLLLSCLIPAPAVPDPATSQWHSIELTIITIVAKPVTCPHAWHFWGR